MALEIRWSLPNIVDMNSLMGPFDRAEAAHRMRLDQLVQLCSRVGRRHVVQRNRAEAAFVVQGHRTKICSADACSVFEHLLENRIQFAGRGTDDLENFRGRGLLLERLAQFGRAQFDLLLQIRIGFLQPRAHVVELVGEQFVAGLDRDALGEIAAADTLGAGAQRLDRADHAPGQEHPRQHREDQRSRQHGGEALQRGVKRRIGFLDRKLDEHHPAKRCDRRGCRQHLLPLNIRRALQGIGAGIRGPCPRRRRCRR